MFTDHGRIAALDIGESIRIAEPAWRDLLAFCDTYDVPIVTAPTAVTESTLRAAAEELAGARDIAIFACPDPNTRVARDLVKTVLGPGAVTGMDALLDKQSTRRLCRTVGVTIPEGFCGPGRQIADAARDLLERTGRVVVKDRHGYAGMGVQVVQDPAALSRLLSDATPVVLEEFIEGQEFSVEVVCAADGLTFVGWLAKGQTSSVGHPLHRMRYAPASEVPALLREPCEKLLTASGYRGIAEIDMIVANGRAYVLECNPRTSGVSATLHFAQRHSSLRRLIAGLLGVALPPANPVAAADYMLPPEHPVAPEPYRAEVYCQHPPADTEYEYRAFLWGDTTDIEHCLVRTDPGLGAQFLQRVAAAQHVLSLG